MSSISKKVTGSQFFGRGMRWSENGGGQALGVRNRVMCPGIYWG
jgi:hypothetical protein